MALTFNSSIGVFTILDIALSCGYEDQGAFTRAFKRFYGITPSEYLTRNLKYSSKYDNYLHSKTRKKVQIPLKWCIL